MIEKKDLKIYYTSDLHGYFYPTSYGDRTDKPQGLFKCLAQFQRDENTLYLDGGDILQGSAYVYYCKQMEDSNKDIAAVMNAAGCDFYAIGNHDFNYGTEYLKSYTKQTTGTCLCQNLTDKNGTPLYPYQIKEMPNGLKLGLVGIVTDYVNIWEKPENIQDVVIADPFEAAKKALEELKNQCDLTICVYHGGFECDPETGNRTSETTENVGYKICKDLDFDILFTGHQHMSVAGKNLFGTYTMQPMEYGKEAYCVTVSREGESWNITSEKILPEAVDAMSENAGQKLRELEAQFEYMETKVQNWLDQPLGHLEQDLLPEDKAEMAYHGSGIADLLNQVQLHYSKAQISAVGLANEIAGFRKNVRTRDIIATYPYPNTLVVLEINGKQLRSVMERSAEYLEYSPEGKLQVAESFLIPKVEHYNYDYYAGVNYEIHPENEPGHRIEKLAFQGKEVEDTEVFTICINNYRATGAGEYPAYKECRVVKEINLEMVELLMNYFAEVLK